MNQRPKIFITLNHKTPKASLEQVAMCLVRTIEAISKRRLQPLHANGEIALRRLQGNVVVRYIFGATELSGKVSYTDLHNTHGQRAEISVSF